MFAIALYRVRQAMVPTVKRLGGYVVRQPAATTTTLQQKSTSFSSSSSSSSSSSLEYTNHAVIPSTTDLTNSSLEDILDVVTGGHVSTCGPLNALCQEANFYQLWTKEYIEHLGDYLLDRATTKTTTLDDNDNYGNNLLVLDIGAGDGLLIRCLQEYMTRKVGKNKTDWDISNQKRGRGGPSNNRTGTNISDPTTNRIFPTLVATDDMSWGIFAKATVEKMSVEQALQKYVPRPKSTPETNNIDGDESANSIVTNNSNNTTTGAQRHRVIVLCSWMPMGLDWTSLFRQYDVEEYILIGEADDGSCGHNWKTWGNPVFFDDSHDADNYGNNVDNITMNNESSSSMEEGTGRVVVPIPPYKMDGYGRWDMDVLSQFQFSSFDCSVSKSSKTVSFQKQRRNL
jgi:hypothetical protein